MILIIIEEKVTMNEILYIDAKGKLQGKIFEFNFNATQFY